MTILLLKQWLEPCIIFPRNLDKFMKILTKMLPLLTIFPKIITTLPIKSFSTEILNPIENHKIILITLNSHKTIPIGPKYNSQPNKLITQGHPTTPPLLKSAMSTTGIILKMMSLHLDLLYLELPHSNLLLDVILTRKNLITLLKYSKTPNMNLT